MGARNEKSRQKFVLSECLYGMLLVLTFVSNACLQCLLVCVVCRPVMSDPGQVVSARQPHTYRPGMKRGSIRTLHDTKSVMFTSIAYCRRSTFCFLPFFFYSSRATFLM